MSGTLRTTNFFFTEEIGHQTKPTNLVRNSKMFGLNNKKVKIRKQTLRCSKLSRIKGDLSKKGLGACTEQKCKKYLAYNSIR